MNKLLSPSIWLLFSLFSAELYAEPRIDYDLDNDGLIEINDLQDLNEIRNNPTLDGEQPSREIRGETLYQSSAGCPASGCNGYELTTDLNFDTNDDGSINASDNYWNDGQGWDSLGSFNLKYVAEFNGNNHTIHNLTINRPGSTFEGFIAYAENAHIHHLKLTANVITGQESGGLLGYGWRTRINNIHADISLEAEDATGDCQSKCGRELVGALVGQGDELTIENVILKATIIGSKRIAAITGGSRDGHYSNIAVHADINAESTAAALLGDSSNDQINSCFVSAHVRGNGSLALLAGSTSDSGIQNILLTGTAELSTQPLPFARLGAISGDVNGSDIKNVISLAHLPAKGSENLFIGALFGSSSQMGELSALYWPRELANNEQSNGQNTASGRFYSYKDLADLQCATEAAGQCNDTRFLHFDQAKTPAGENLWHFGSNTEAPAMKINGYMFADTDGNGTVDHWPDVVVTAPPPDNKPDAPTGGNSSSSSSSGGALPYWWISLFAFVLLAHRALITQNKNRLSRQR